jgi:hypothetical protein
MGRARASAIALFVSMGVNQTQTVLVHLVRRCPDTVERLAAL